MRRLTGETMTAADKIVLLGALYLAQGLPFGFFTQALPVMMRELGYSLEQIGLASLLAVPWAAKFLWAPLIDRYGSSRFGRRRSWIIPLQVATALLLAVLALLSPRGTLTPLLWAVLFVNVLNATQDIATDGLAVDLLSQPERGLANGVQVAGYRFGMILGGGVLLILYERLEWGGTFLVLALATLAATAPVVSLRERPVPGPDSGHTGTGAHSPHAAGHPGPDPRPDGTGIALDTAHFLRRPDALRLLALILFFKVGDHFAVGMIRPFLSDYGLSLAEIGWVVGTLGFAGGLLGALAGGALVNHLGRRRALVTFGLLQAVTVLGYAFVARATPARPLLYAVCAAEHFAAGMATAALFTCMMDWSRPRHAATDYTVQASVVVIATLAASTLSGFSAGALGYTAHFLLAAALAFVALVFVVYLFPKPASSLGSSHSSGRQHHVEV